MYLITEVKKNIKPELIELLELENVKIKKGLKRLCNSRTKYTKDT